MDSAQSACCLPPGVSRGHWASELPEQRGLSPLSKTALNGWASQEVLEVKNPPASAGGGKGMGSIPGLERSPGEGNGSPLSSCCLENPMDRGTWQATVHMVGKSWTQHVRTNVEIPKVSHRFCFLKFWS